MTDVGHEVRQLLEAGRASMLAKLGYSTELLQYAPSHATSENIVIAAAKPRSESPYSQTSAPNALPKVGVLLETPSAASRVTQFLMEVRGQVLEQTGTMPFLATFACSDDSAVVLGTSEMEVVSALRRHAMLLVQLRIVTRIFPHLG